MTPHKDALSSQLEDCSSVISWDAEVTVLGQLRRAQNIDKSWPPKFYDTTQFT